MFMKVKHHEPIGDIKCDVCGKPATSISTDVVKHYVPGKDIYRHSYGHKHAGCDEHEVHSTEYEGPSLSVEQEKEWGK